MQQTFKLKNGRTPETWVLPTRGVSANYKGEEQYIGYFESSNSILVNDPINKNKKQPEIVFEEGVLTVSDRNVKLLEYLKLHPWYNVHFELMNEAIQTERKLATYEEKAEAMQLINDLDNEKVQATAIAILGLTANGWSPEKAKLILLQKAVEEPNTIISSMNSKEFEPKFYASMVFFSGLVKETLDHSAVVWNNPTEEVLLRLSVGETGISKLSEVLLDNSAASTTLIQRIASKLKERENELKSKKNVDNDLQKRLAELEAENARLKSNKTTENIVNNIEVKAENVGSETEIDFENVDIEVLQAMYMKAYDKDFIGGAQKTNRPWLTAKIKEAKGLV